MESGLSRSSGARPVRRGVARGLRCGFTLIEVLVVASIIALLLAILLPSLQQARRQARLTLCLNNLHQLSIGLYSYQVDFKNVPRWQVYKEHLADGLALWVQGAKGEGHATRLGMLYPRYIGKNENVFYCPDSAKNGLLNKGTEGKTGASLYPWKNFGTDFGWAYGSYEYRPRYFFGGAGQVEWVGAKYDTAKTGRLSIAADGFAGSWDSFGPFPVHTPIQLSPKMLYYNVAFMDGSARAVKDPIQAVAAGKEFRTRAGVVAQQKPAYVNTPREGGIGTTSVGPEYTPLAPGPQNPPLPIEVAQRNNVLSNSNHIERGWTFFDRK